MTGMGMNWRQMIVALSALVAAGVGSAAVKRGPDMTLEQLTKKSDAIVIGKCKAKQARWVKGHIETDYEIVVDETLKGGKSYQAGSSFRMTVMGGSTTTPPITQFSELQAHMFVGENVALFLRTAPGGTPETREKAAKMGSNLLNTPRVVGNNQGKFSILTDAKDGRRKLTRVNLEEYNVVPNDTALYRVLRAVARHDVAVTTQPVVQLGGGLVTSPEGKNLLDQVAEQSPAGAAPSLDEMLNANAKGTRSDASGKAPARFKRGAPVPVQDLDEFKNQVRQFAN